MQIILLLLDQPTNDSTEIAISFTKAIGATLEEHRTVAFHVFGRFRDILQQGGVSKKTQYQVEGLMAVRKAGFEKQGLVAVRPELDLLESNDQIEHDVRAPALSCAVDHARPVRCVFIDWSQRSQHCALVTALAAVRMWLRRPACNMLNLLHRPPRTPRLVQQPLSISHALGNHRDSTCGDDNCPSPPLRHMHALQAVRLAPDPRVRACSSSSQPSSTSSAT